MPKESNSSDHTDSDDDIEGDNKFKEKELNKSSLSFPTVMYDGPNISLVIGPGEGYVSFTSEPNWKALAFSNTGRSHFSEEREIPITPSEYVHTRLKCCDDRIAANPQ